MGEAGGVGGWGKNLSPLTPTFPISPAPLLPTLPTLPYLSISPSPMPDALIQLQDIPIKWQTLKESISQAKVVQ